MSKNAFIQIRVTPEQKRRLKALAAEQELTLSEWVLNTLLSPEPRKETHDAGN